MTPSAAEARRAELDRRPRAACIEGAEEDSGRRLGRGLTPDELERVLRRSRRRDGAGGWVMSPASRFLAILAVVVVLAACSSLEPILRPGFRQIVMRVENTSTRPAILVVAEDEAPMGAVVGTADPGTVPPNTTMDVTFGLPPEPGWAIFVNPGPEQGPLFLESDVPADASGRAPFTILVGGQGDEVGAMSDGDTRGWMGEP